MTLQLPFGYLICSYLPGIPLALAVFFFLPKEIRTADAETIGRYLVVAYILLSPLIIGLFVDGLRHLIELGIEKRLCRGKTRQENPKRPCCLLCCIYWPWRPEVERIAQKNADKPELLRTLLFYYNADYHLFEFFSNFAISTFVFLVFCLSTCLFPYTVVLGITIPVTVVSFCWACVFRELGERITGKAKEQLALQRQDPGAK